jgi:prophage regulatory protein
LENELDNSNTVAGAFLRLPQVLEMFPVCRSTWWKGVKTGIYPAGIKLSPNTTAWHSRDIDALIETIRAGQEHQKRNQSDATSTGVPKRLRADGGAE